MKITSARFVKSVANIDQCVTGFPMFAFFGRSNVGKSSLINMLTQKNDLAKHSKIPGKTKLFNFFIINESFVIVDLPGYGYAKSGRKERIDWMDFTQTFLTSGKDLVMTFLLIDSSIPPQRIDMDMISCFIEEGVNFSIVFTKMDKCNNKEFMKNQRLFNEEMKKIGLLNYKSFIVDNIHGKGRDELLNFIESYL